MPLNPYWSHDIFYPEILTSFISNFYTIKYQIFFPRYTTFLNSRLIFYFSFLRKKHALLFRQKSQYTPCRFFFSIMGELAYLFTKAFPINSTRTFISSKLNYDIKNPKRQSSETGYCELRLSFSLKSITKTTGNSLLSTTWSCWYAHYTFYRTPQKGYFG